MPAFAGGVALSVAKSGPKLKVGDRYASGRLKPNCPSGPSPVAIKRAVEAALRGAGDPRWGSTIGRLRLEGVIVDRQLGAAESYGKLRGKFDRAMGMPRRSTASVFYEAGRGYATQRELDEDELDRLRTDHDRMLAEVGPLRTVLDRVVLFDEAPLPGELPRLKAGLEMLVAFFRIGEA